MRKNGNNTALSMRLGGFGVGGGCREGNELDNAQMSTFSLPAAQTNRKTLNFSNWERSVLPDEQGGRAHDWNTKTDGCD